MAFVKCSTYKTEQAEQDSRLDALETCCESNNTKNSEQDKAIAELSKGLNNAAKNLAGSGLQATNDGKLEVKTVRLVDASGTVHLGNLVGHTKGDGKQTTDDIPAVAPVNMGKSLKFDGKEYNVQVGQTLQVTDSGLVQVKLSQVSGNLLQQYDDGLYYGIQAPANVSNLYVDAVNGVDQDPNEVKGAGTRAKPLKTIAYAISLVPTNTSTTLWLHEQQEHKITSARSVNLSAIMFRTYGDTYDSYLKLPTINGDPNLAAMYNPSNNAKILLSAARVLTNNSAKRIYRYVELGTLYFYNADVTFYGVDVVADFSFTADNVGMIDLGTVNKATDVARIVEMPYFIFSRNSNVVFNRSRITSKGSPTVNVSGENKVIINQQGAMLSKTANGLWEGSVLYLDRCSVNFFHTDVTCECNLFGDIGWSNDQRSTNSLQVNSNHSEVGKRMSYAVITNGVVQAPSTNLKANVFTQISQ